ncbi:unnamed protein product [Spirodela intermedia]|uniref:Uncharacterized protein n=1 Tax=Spirodela intermedia TaxID=51605 RepID=A0A7I8JRA4_SPIIN|nr:unnamed protein product [Spirodela intermedia]CAA6672700.1 unnamed protein product [Spirodela intermedia]
MLSAKGVVRILSEGIVKPRLGAVAGGEAPADHPRRCELSLWDLSMFSVHYIQKGHLFSLPSGDPPVEVIVERLKSSLSIAPWHFYPLASRLATEMDADGRGMFVHIDCDVQGPDFSLPLPLVWRTVSSSGAPSTTSLATAPPFGASSTHGPRSRVPRKMAAATSPSRRCSRGGSPTVGPPSKMPFTHEDQFIEMFSPPPLREKMFHFTGACITRLRRFPDDQKVGCRLAAENQRRLRPQLPPAYFGNSIYAIPVTTTAGELLSNDLDWAAGMLNQAVPSQTDAAIRGMVESGRCPHLCTPSPDFGGGGMRRRCAARARNKFDGKISAYPGREGGGSVDLEVCLLPDVMSSLESDEEFTQALSPAGR